MFSFMKRLPRRLTVIEPVTVRSEIPCGRGLPSYSCPGTHGPPGDHHTWFVLPSRAPAVMAMYRPSPSFHGGLIGPSSGTPTSPFQSLRFHSKPPDARTTPFVAAKVSSLPS